MPARADDQPIVTDNRDGTVSIKYDPKEEGCHELHIKHNQEHVPGSPYKFHVDNSSGYITAGGSGLSAGIAGEPCNFTVYTKGKSINALNVTVEGPTTAEVNLQDNSDGSVNVSYIPPAPGEYKIAVKMMGKHIRGSPYTTKIKGEGRKRSQLSIAHSSEVSLPIQEKDIRNLNASIVAPSGLEEPCFVKKQKENQLGVCFNPREKGEHVVNIKRVGQHIKGSPSKINVEENEIGDASKVKVTGVALREGKTQMANKFEISTKGAGFGGLNLSVEGPSKVELAYDEYADGTIKATYKPSEPGFYVINLKFADHHVPGSPWVVKVTGEGSDLERVVAKKHFPAAPIADVGKKTTWLYRMTGTCAFDMIAKVTNPSADTEDCEILDKEDSIYAVHFVPKEAGVHILSIRHKELHIPGSPFQYTVGNFLDSGGHRVQAGGQGLERGLAEEPCEFNIWTREAGPGTLAVSVEGPSKAEIDIRDTEDETVNVVSYTVDTEGDYRIGIKFNDEPIPDSPFNVYIIPSTGEARKIELGRIPDGLQINKPLAFNIQMNGAKGMLDGKTVSPSGHEDDCFVTPIDEDQWALRFVPKENGIYEIHIRLNGVHIRESPFRVLIGEDNSDPAAVTSMGNGLVTVRAGSKTDFIVDTCNAGAGQLTVTIEGPCQVAMDCTEVEEGYKVRYTPLVSGDYFIFIKFNGYHIVGSPFKVHVTGPASSEPATVETSTVVVEAVLKQAKQKADHLPRFRSDATKVTSKGPALKKGVLRKQNQFTVNCLDAGNNMIYVAMYGPKGPIDELQVKHLGRSLYQVQYVSKDRGDHILIVKWGEEHIPGSPFKVEVAPS